MIAFRRNKDLPRDPEEMPEYERWRLINQLVDLNGGQNWKRRMSDMILGGKRIPIASGGQFYQDTRPPWTLADITAVTLATTMKQMWPTADLTPTYQTDWWDGKLFMMRCFGRITTALTPGNLTIQLGYGTADGTTGALATSAALTLVASQTNISWRFEGRVRCRSKGVAASTGILFGTGVFECNPAVIAAGQGLIPATAPAQVGSLNLSATSGLHVQFARSGSTAETAQVHDLMLAAEN